MAAGYGMLDWAKMAPAKRPWESTLAESTKGGFTLGGMAAQRFGYADSLAKQSVDELRLANAKLAAIEKGVFGFIDAMRLK